MERFGSLRAAFERMDFHRDGHVSCLEFQEVISGQERYCQLQEARELFSVLAKGTAGWLNWEVFRKRLQGAWNDPEDLEMTSCHSESASAVASHALRNLLLKERSPPTPRGGASAASTAMPTEAVALEPSWASLSSGHGAPFSPMPGRHLDARLSGRLRPTSQEDARLDTCSSPGARAFTSTLSSPLSLAEQLFRGALQESPDAQRIPHREGSVARNRGGDALRKLEESLFSLQGEVASAKAAMEGGAPVMATPKKTLWGRRHVPGDACSPPRSTWPSPEGPEGRHRSCADRPPSASAPRWVRRLPPSAQGRLSACSSSNEALKVLEEVVELKPGQEAPRPEEASYEEVAAALALLQQAKEKVARLEAQRDERRKQSSAEAASLRKRREKERRSSLRQLLLRLAPPGSAFAKPRGAWPSSGPLASPRSKVEVVEQRCPAPIPAA